MSYQLEGTIEKIGDVQKFKNDFTKVEVIVKKVDGEYENMIRFETVNKVAERVVENLKVGQKIKAQFDLRGNEYKGKFYTNLVMYKWDVLNEDALNTIDVMDEAPY